MGLFLHKCYQIRHLSLLARFSQHIKYSSVRPAAYFRCLPCPPWPCAHTWKRSTRSQPALPGAAAPPGTAAPPRAAPPSRGGAARREGTASPAGAAPPPAGSRCGERPGRGSAGHGWPGGCRVPGAPLGVLGPAGQGGRAAACAIAAAQGPGHSRRCKTSPAWGNKPLRLPCVTRFFKSAPATGAASGAALTAAARQHCWGPHTGTHPKHPWANLGVGGVSKTTSWNNDGEGEGGGAQVRVEPCSEIPKQNVKRENSMEMWKHGDIHEMQVGDGHWAGVLQSQECALPPCSAWHQLRHHSVSQHTYGGNGDTFWPLMT